MERACNGISAMHSPREIVLKRSVDFDLHCRTDFEQYVHAHIKAKKTNDMNERPKDNLQGTSKSLGYLLILDA